MTDAAFGSLNPQPVFPFWLLAASAEQTPLPEEATWAQQAELQSALETQPPVMNCAPLPAPTFFEPAALGVTWAMEAAATESKVRFVRIKHSDGRTYAQG
jgi:hypothetical protein